MKVIKTCQQFLKDQLRKYKYQSTQNSLSKLIKQLTYGKNLYYFNTFIQQYRSIVLYLHQTDPQILIAVDKQNKDFVMYFQIKRLNVSQAHYDYQKMFGLSRHIYLILQDPEDIIILLFNDPTIQETEQQTKRNREQADFYYVNLRDLAFKMIECQSQLDSTMIKNFLKADINKDHSLSINQISNMFSQIKIDDQIIKNDIINFIKQQIKFEKFNYKDFQTISKLICCKQQLIETFETYGNIRLRQLKSYLQKSMDHDQFKKFLMQIQYQNQETANKIATKVIQKQKSKRISFYDFSLFMTSAANDITMVQYASKLVSSNQPLLSYLCFSSNNTYLAGNDILSDFRAERYYEDLEKGIRCVDIDCFDGPDGPTVKQGDSFCRYISFQSVLKEIDKFINMYTKKQDRLPTPIIISITNKCNIVNQGKMANSLQSIFGNKIFRISQREYHDKYPVMADLMGKIIIKTIGTIKIYQQLCNVSLKMKTEQNISLSQIHDMENKSKTDIKSKQSKIQSFQGGSIQFLLKRHKFEQRKEQLQFQMKKFLQKKIKIDLFVSTRSQQNKDTTKYDVEQYNRELLKLTSLFSNGRLGQPNCWQCIMLGQQKLFRYYKDQSDRRVISFQSTNGWIRTYPKKLRISNTNFNPIQMGIQIISMNTQIADAELMVLKKFFQKGSDWLTGYRLRPNLKGNRDIKKIIITPISATKIYYDDTFRSKQIPQCQIKMKFYSYVKDMPKNKENMQWKQYTELIKNNAYNPIFKYSTSIILRYTEEQLGFVAVKIENVGIGVIPLQNIRQGYRTVTLYDHRAMPKLSKVMFSVVFETVKVIKK